jgi:phosphoglycolate phosphatase
VTIPAFPVYLFDIDGTLVDSAQDICGAIQCVLSSTTRNGVEFDFLKGYIGRHLLDLFRDLDFPEDQIDPMICEYRRIYADRKHSMTKLYPGVLEAIGGLPGRKSTATTKGTPTTRIVLELFGLLPYFDHVQGTDGFPAKPEPDVLFRALEGLKASPADCLFVGDSAADMEAGRRAGIKTAAVTYGYGKREDLARFEPDYWINDLRELASAGKSNGAAR